MYHILLYSLYPSTHALVLMAELPQPLARDFGDKRAQTHTELSGRLALPPHLMPSARI